MVVPSRPLVTSPSTTLCDDPSLTLFDGVILPHAFLTEGCLVAGGFSRCAISLLLLLLAEDKTLTVGSGKRGCSLAYIAFPVSEKLVAGVITATSAITVLNTERTERDNHAKQL